MQSLQTGLQFKVLVIHPIHQASLIPALLLSRSLMLIKHVNKSTVLALECDEINGVTRLKCGTGAANHGSY